MASVWRHPESKFWFACFTLPDGRRTKRSTKKTNRSEAQKIADRFEEAARSVVTEAQARRVLSDIYQIVRGKDLKSSTIAAYLERWAVAKQHELTPSTAAKYKRVAEQFTAHLGPKAAQDLGHLEKDDVAAFRDALAGSLSIATANGALKILRVAFGQARRDGLVTANPAEQVKILRNKRTGAERRPFTLPELRRIIEVADPEMRGLILFGLYTGQRLGDLARLTWQNLDLQRGELHLVTTKTGRRQIIPLADPLVRYISSCPASNNPSEPLFPKAAATVADQRRTGTLSNRFYGVLVDAGLAEARSHHGKGKGRNAKRILSNISFHSLRHTATSLLKNAGVSDAVAREFIGHDSPAISANYTHIETAALRKAAESLPDLLSK
jgi:integrase